MVVQFLKVSVVSALAAVMFAPLADAQSMVLDKNEERIFQDFDWLPFAFSSESFGFAVGVGVGYSGWPQEQSSAIGALTVGTEGAYNIVGALTDWQVPGMPRLVVEPMFSLGKFENQRLHVGQGREPGSVRAGANDSDPDDFLEASQWDNRAEIEFRFLLPVGHGRDDIVSRYIIDGGLVTRGQSGGSHWNPMASGRTSVSLTPSWREQTEEIDGFEIPLETINATLALERDNYDFPFNPSRGSYQSVAFQRDFSDAEALGGWESWSLELGKAFELPSGEGSAQRVFALGFWTAYVPTWETEDRDGVEHVTKRPPHYEGATLGGIYRMRAYEDHRFQDKAAIYYSAEYRTIPEWQPLKNLGWLQWADVSWWQWVVFAEGGQVSPTYQLDALHDDMHFDAGFSLRVMAHKAVCRLDFASGAEGGRLIAMYGHPF